MGESQYWRKFIAILSLIATPLHPLKIVKHVFQWEGKQQKSFNTLKEKISTTLVPALPYLKQPLEIQTGARKYVMGPVLMQHGYHHETFTNAIINYPTCGKELYALVQSVKKWKHHLMGKEMIIHIDHQPLQYYQATIS